MEEKIKLKFLSVFLVVALFVGLAVPARAAAASSSDPYSITWAVLSDIVTLPGHTFSYDSYYIQYPNDSEHRFTWWYAMLDVLTDFATDSSQVGSYIKEMSSDVNYIDQIYNLLNGNNGLIDIRSKLSVLNGYVLAIKNSIAPSYRTAIEIAQGDNIDQVSDDFLSGEVSSSSLGPSDFSDLNSFVSGAGVMLDSPSSASYFTSALDSGISSSSGLKFFTQSVKDDLTVESVRGSGEFYIDFLSSRLEEVEDFLGGDSR